MRQNIIEEHHGVLPKRVGGEEFVNMGLGREEESQSGCKMNVKTVNLLEQIWRERDIGKGEEEISSLLLTKSVF